MRKRTIRVQLLLTEKEYVRLTTNAAKCGFSISGYIRELLNKHEPKEMPPIEYYRILNQLYRITESLREKNTDPSAERNILIEIISELRTLIGEMRNVLYERR